MRCLIITVAGMATRFSQSVGFDCIKCLFYEKNFEESILYRLISGQADSFDKIILVGGFKYGQLEDAVQNHLQAYQDKICLVMNDHYSDFGSGYSFLLGLEKAFSFGPDEIVFAEGDLYVDPVVLDSFCRKETNLISYNCEPILASKAVAFYFDTTNRIHYIFDTSHGQLSIDEPFLEIRNSGQIWKFMDVNYLKQICDNLTDSEKQGTNLCIIQQFFGKMDRKEYELIEFKKWLNCNTLNDFRKIKELEE